MESPIDPSKIETELNEEIEALTLSLKQHQQLMELMSQRIDVLEKQAIDNAAQAAASMFLMNSIVQNAENRNQVLALAQSNIAQWQVQPSVLLHNNQHLIQRVNHHLQVMAMRTPKPD